MTQREKLIDLLPKAVSKCKGSQGSDNGWGEIVDYLISNGVIVLPREAGDAMCGSYRLDLTWDELRALHGLLSSKTLLMNYAGYSDLDPVLLKALFSTAKKCTDTFHAARYFTFEETKVEKE